MSEVRGRMSELRYRQLLSIPAALVSLVTRTTRLFWGVTGRCFMMGCRGIGLMWFG